MFLAFFRQTLFKDGVVLYLAIWEVVRKGKMMRRMLISYLTLCLGIQIAYLSAVAFFTLSCWHLRPF